MLTPTRVVMLLTPLALVACGQSNNAEPDMAPGAEMAEDINPADTGETASAEGAVTAIDDEGGTITIDHGPVPEVDWPAMIMSFEASEEQRASVSKGDMVTFEFQNTEAGSKILSLSRN